MWCCVITSSENQPSRIYTNMPDLTYIQNVYILVCPVRLCYYSYQSSARHPLSLPSDVSTEEGTLFSSRIVYSFRPIRRPPYWFVSSYFRSRTKGKLSTELTWKQLFSPTKIRWTLDNKRTILISFCRGHTKILGLAYGLLPFDNVSF